MQEVGTEVEEAASARAGLGAAAEGSLSPGGDCSPPASLGYRTTSTSSSSSPCGASTLQWQRRWVPSFLNPVQLGSQVPAHHLSYRPVSHCLYNSLALRQG